MLTLTCSFTLHLSGRNERYYRSNPDLVKERLADQLASGLDPLSDDLRVSNVKITPANPQPDSRQ